MRSRNRSGLVVTAWLAAALADGSVAQAQSEPGGELADADVSPLVTSNDAIYRGDVHVTLATGQMDIFPAVTGSNGLSSPFIERESLLAQAGSPSVWDNTDHLGAGGVFPWQTWGSEVSIEWVTWGTIDPGTLVVRFAVAYATHLPDPEAEGVEGLDLLLSFWEDYEGFGEPATLLRTFRIENLPGSDGLRNMWVLTVDLEGSGQEFLIDAGTPDDEGKVHFAFGYAWDTSDVAQPEAVGPVLTLPANKGGEGTSTGSEGVFDLYLEPWDASQASFFAPFVFELPFVPFPSFYLNLYADEGGSPCPADCDADGSATVLDLVCFQGLFADGDPAADCNADQHLDIADFPCFQLALANGCP